MMGARKLSLSFLAIQFIVKFTSCNLKVFVHGGGDNILQSGIPISFAAEYIPGLACQVLITHVMSSTNMPSWAHSHVVRKNGVI